MMKRSRLVLLALLCCLLALCGCKSKTVSPYTPKGGAQQGGGAYGSGGFPEGAAVRMGLAVLNHMALIEIDPDEARLSVPPGRKGSPEDDALFRRLTLLNDEAAEKE